MDLESFHESIELLGITKDLDSVVFINKDTPEDELKDIGKSYSAVLIDGVLIPEECFLLLINSYREGEKLMLSDLILASYDAIPLMGFGL